MDCSTPGFPVHHQLLEFTQTHVPRVVDAIQPSHPLSSPFPPTFNLSQHQGLFQWVSSSHGVAKVLELQLQHQLFQWIFRADFIDWIDWFVYLTVEGILTSLLQHHCSKVSILLHSAFRRSYMYKVYASSTVNICSTKFSKYLIIIIVIGDHLFSNC